MKIFAVALMFALCLLPGPASVNFYLDTEGLTVVFAMGYSWGE